MNTTPHNSSEAQSAHLIRLGGASILIAMAVHIVANSVIKVMPPEGMSPDDLQAYLTEQDANWAVVHGMRYIAIVAMAIFAGGLFQRCCIGRTSNAIAWGIVGLIGCTLHIANIVITNAIETYIFLSDQSIPSDQFWLVFLITRMLFTAEIVLWGISILGFSSAGWSSRTLPRPICILGWISAPACVLSSIFVVSVWRYEWASIFMTIGSMTGLLWYICVGVYLLIRGNASNSS